MSERVGLISSLVLSFFLDLFQQEEKSQDIPDRVLLKSPFDPPARESTAVARRGAAEMRVRTGAVVRVVSVASLVDISSLTTFPTACMSLVDSLKEDLDTEREKV